MCFVFIGVGYGRGAGVGHVLGVGLNRRVGVGLGIGADVGVDVVPSHGNDLARGEVVKIPWIGRVVARVIGIRKVVQHCVERKVVEIRKRKARTSVKEMVGHKIVEEDAAVSIIGIKPIFVAHIKVVDPVRGS